MNNFSKVASFIFVSAFCLQSTGYAQNSQPTSISLNSLAEFRLPGNNWVLASDVSFDLIKPGVMKTKSGTGIIVNAKDGTNLVTNEELGDIELDLDFMVSRGSASSIYIQGLYEVQLADSWTKLNPTFADMGGIAERGGEARFGFQGVSPSMNIAKAPGLWQHLKVKFRAPRFTNGIKTTNARFEEIYVNGTLVQEQIEVTGPTKGTAGNEVAKGSLILKGNGGIIAFRNITYSTLAMPQPPAAPAAVNPAAPRRGGPRVVNPILLEPGSKPYLLRSYLNFGTKKLTHVISMGDPNGLSYSYDLKQGALLQVWRGRFADVTAMWEARGEPQLARPNGSVVMLSGEPALASLANPNAVWPDSIAFDDLNSKGYILDKQRVPTFRYAFNGIDVTDRISTVGNGESVIREITVSNGPSNLYLKIVTAKTIESIGKGLYAIDDKSYYIQVDERLKPLIRNTQKGQELITAVGKTATPLSYSIIW